LQLNEDEEEEEEKESFLVISRAFLEEKKI